MATLLKTKSALYQLRATQAFHGYLKERGLNPSMHIMDNECPDTVKNTCATTTLLFSSSCLTSIA